MTPPTEQDLRSLAEAHGLARLYALETEAFAAAVRVAGELRAAVRCDDLAVAPAHVCRFRPRPEDQR